MLFVKTFLNLHCRVCDKEKCRNMKIHCQETGHCSCLSVNCTKYCTILRHKVDDLGFRTYEKPLCMYCKYILLWPPIYTYILRLILTLIVVQGELDQHFSFILVTLLKIYYDSSSNTTKVITLLERP